MCDRYLTQAKNSKNNKTYSFFFDRYIAIIYKNTSETNISYTVHRSSLTA
jgi:hypothetical protein